ncbi:hypothetical protein SKAU_G00341330 [Synaphobranchus kaupii]|uniref:Carbohydrate kinase PfkB domain-containing protein n=1 Tax=Synaphobranchus kaupii TaxID=118154 RepID=A0A9Q1EN82_SYNKA|nr:hypothetical protein SKAU_G00341330 [Synaphobranchus kaupii]
MGDKKILCIGLVCLDIINVVDKYPEEDTDSRCLSQRWQRGGNASNSCTVLSILGAPCAFMGSLAPGPVADFVLADFLRYEIDVSLLAERAECSFPASVVISNVRTGSRTILHMNRFVRACRGCGGGTALVSPSSGRGFFTSLSPVGVSVQGLTRNQTAVLPSFSFIAADFARRGVDVSGVAWQREGETPCACCVVCPASGTRTVVLFDTNLPDVSAEDFSRVDLNQYKWIHWEGRNAEEQVKMIQQVEHYNSTLTRDKRITISVEIEKTREPLYQLFPYGDVVFVSKDVARHFGFQTAADALRGFYSRVKKGAVLICAWAEKGADAMGPDGVIVHSDAFPPEALVDTLGAGDTFNASVIFTLSHGKSLQEALSFGCQVAGRKCGVHGYDDIVPQKS